MIKNESSLAGRATPVTYTGGTFVNSNRKESLLYVGTSGNLVCTMMEDSTPVTFTGLAVGYHPLNVKSITEAGTTASNILVLM